MQGTSRPFRFLVQRPMPETTAFDGGAVIMPKLWRIFEPVSLGNVVCRNRILMAAHSYGYVDEEGLPTQHLVDYLAERAKGGVALIIMGGTSISLEGSLIERITVNVNDRIVPWYRKIADEVHRHGAVVFDQLAHVGGQLDAYEGSRVVGPSSIPHEMCNAIPVELTISEIREIVDDFAEATHRAKLGGLDGVELKCDQGFLVHQFLSPYYNRRSDKYGGAFRKRLRFLTELIEKVRTTVGSDFVVGTRITGDAMTPGDLTLDDGIRIAQAIEDTGCIDYIHVNGATNSTYRGYLFGHGDSSVENANFARLARKVREAVDLPVIVTSLILDPRDAEHLITSGAADMVAMTRAHIADAEVVNKSIENRFDDIRPCVLCNQGCVGNHWRGSDVRCIHNAATGRERELGIGTVQRASERRTVAVIGGGPAGLEVARIAAMRGHEVELYEKEGELGGQILLAKELPYRQGLSDIVRYLERQTKRLGVRIYRGAEVTANDLITVSSDFDVVVIATGAEPYIPPIYNDVDPICVLNIRDVLEQRVELGDHILVVSIDWRQNALGLVEWLTLRDRKVTLTSPAWFVGEGLDVVTLTSYYSRIQKTATLLPLIALSSLRNRTARVRNVLSNEVQEIHPIDQVLFVTGAKPVNNLFISVKDKLDNVFCVGDCVAPRGIPEAILDANRLARML